MKSPFNNLLFEMYNLRKHELGFPSTISVNKKRKYFDYYL